MKIERWTGVGDLVKGLDYQAKVFVLYFIISLKLFEQHTDGPANTFPYVPYLVCRRPVFNISMLMGINLVYHG